MKLDAPFDKYIPLAQEEFDFPLFETIQRLNWLSTTSIVDPAHLHVFMQKYTDLTDRIPEAFIQHHVGLENGSEEAQMLFFTLFESTFDGMFDFITGFPFSMSPYCMCRSDISSVIPVEFQFWNIVTACQLLLPIMTICKKRYESIVGRKPNISIIICTIDRFLMKRFPVGYSFIVDTMNRRLVESKINVPFVEALGDVLLIGFTKLDLLNTKYINMGDINGIFSRVLSGLKIFTPNILPKTELF